MKRLSYLALICLLSFGTVTMRAWGQAPAPTSGASPAPIPFDYKAKFLDDMKDLQSKFVGLAQAIPQDKYTWRPGTGVRSISEVFLHVAGGNFALTPMMGAKPYEGYNRQNYETSTTDK